MLLKSNTILFMIKGTYLSLVIIIRFKTVTSKFPSNSSDYIRSASQVDLFTWDLRKFVQQCHTSCFWLPRSNGISWKLFSCHHHNFHSGIFRSLNNLFLQLLKYKEAVDLLSNTIKKDLVILNILWNSTIRENWGNLKN